MTDSLPSLAMESPLLQYGLLGLRLFAVLLAASFVVFPLGATLQERKNFRDVGLGLYGHVNSFFFIQFWMAFSALCVLAQLPQVLLGRDVSHASNTYYEHLIGTWGFKLFVGRCDIVGEKNLPPPPPPGGVSKDAKAVVFVFNHQSMIDICVLYFLRQRFAWVSKKSVTFLPGVGQIMWLSGHVLLSRGGKDSIKQMFTLCKSRLSNGVSIFIFPQGTRERCETLPFKHGAFSLAGGGETEYDVVPVSIDISPYAWRMNPFGSGFENGTERKAAVTITVHPRLVTSEYTKGVDKGNKEELQRALEKLNKAAFDAIYSVLEIKKGKPSKTSEKKD